MLSYERESKSRGRGRALKTKRPNGRNKRGGRGRKRGGREADRFPGGREGPAGGRAPPRPASSPRPVPGRAGNCQVKEGSAEPFVPNSVPLSLREGSFSHSSVTGGATRPNATREGGSMCVWFGCSALSAFSTGNSLHRLCFLFLLQ